MKKSIVIVLISAGIISIVTSLSYRLQSKETHQASARIWLDPGVGTGFIYYPNFLQDQIQAISNHLCQPDNRMTLARQSNVDEKDFCLITVGPVNGTRLLYARFTGYESNQVMCVASNAGLMLVNFYSTNQPAWDVRYEEPRYFAPETFWQRKLEDVKSMFSSTFRR